MNVGQRLRRCRKNSGMTLQNIAESTGLSQPFLSEIERGLKKPSLDNLQKICTALGITLAEFFADTSEEIPLELRQLLNEARKLSPEQTRQIAELIRSLKEP